MAVRLKYILSNCLSKFEIVTERERDRKRETERQRDRVGQTDGILLSQKKEMGQSYR